MTGIVKLEREIEDRLIFDRMIGVLRILKLSKDIEDRLGFTHCKEDELLEAIKEALYTSTEEDLLKNMNAFNNGKVIFNCEGGEGDFYYYIENNKIMHYRAISIEEKLTMESLKWKGSQSLINDLSSLINDVFLGESTWICKFE